MNKFVLKVSFAVLASAALLGCWDEDSCESDQDQKGNYCFDRPAPPSDGGGGTDDGSGSQSAFGKACTDMSQCSGDAPICAPDPLNYCMTINCAAGEANEGKCPSGWTCLETPGNPSACLKM